MNRPLHQVGTRQSMSLNMNEVFGVVRSHVTHHATARRHCALCHVHLFFHSFAQLLVRSELIKDRVAASHLSLLQLLFISPVNGSTMKLSFGSLCFSQNNSVISYLMVCPNCLKIHSVIIYSPSFRSKPI